MKPIGITPEDTKVSAMDYGPPDSLRLTDLLGHLLTLCGPKNSLVGPIILAHAHRHPALSLQDIASLMGLPPTTLRTHCYSLQNQGLLTLTTRSLRLAKSRTAYLSLTCSPQGEAAIKKLLTFLQS